MKISTKGRYGLRIMLELSLCYEKKLLTAREIAENQSISEKYIEQIIGMLTKAGLIKSQRGAAGGYRLAHPPASLTVGTVLRVTEGGLSIIDCLTESMDKEPCEMKPQCVTMQVWQKVNDAIESVVDNITLADLVTQHNEQCNFAYMI